MLFAQPIPNQTESRAQRSLKVHTIIKRIWRTDNEMAQKRQWFADDTVNQLCYNSYAGNYGSIAIGR